MEAGAGLSPTAFVGQGNCSRVLWHSAAFTPGSQLGALVHQSSPFIETLLVPRPWLEGCKDSFSAQEEQRTGMGPDTCCTK